MPGKTKQDYLDLPFSAGQNRTKIILNDAILDKGVDPVLKCLTYQGSQIRVCLMKEGVRQSGYGATKAEATADAAAKF